MRDSDAGQLVDALRRIATAQEQQAKEATRTRETLQGMWLTYCAIAARNDGALAHAEIKRVETDIANINGDE